MACFKARSNVTVTLPSMLKSSPETEMSHAGFVPGYRSTGIPGHVGRSGGFARSTEKHPSARNSWLLMPRS